MTGNDTAAEVMSREYARMLTDDIRHHLEGLWESVAEAYRGRAWEVLGYGSWNAYVQAEFGTAHLKVPVDERPAVIKLMRNAGMSLRAISAATGMSKDTVSRSEGVSDETRGPVRGTDGKTYQPKSKPKLKVVKDNLPPDHNFDEIARKANAIEGFRKIAVLMATYMKKYSPDDIPVDHPKYDDCARIVMEFVKEYC